jgi:heat shock protein HslJ
MGLRMKLKLIWPSLAAVAVVASVAACGARRGELPSELDGRWNVQQIAGASLGEGVRIELEIDAETGALTGFTGCNRFSGSMTAFERMLAVRAVQEEDGACASEAAATDETRFLRVLPSVQRFVRRGKSLELLAQPSGDDALLRLRLEEPAEGAGEGS